MLKDAMAQNSDFTPFASRETITWQKDLKLQEAGRVCAEQQG